ncbi:MAG: DNA-processing protein DprA [Myxococcales bacterium]|nr:DNA-processing protein DprA [Myxococcales bacterium]
MVAAWQRGPEASDYPPGLTRLTRPPRLDGRGALPAAPAVAIVGSRAASAAALATATALAAHAAARGWCVVSGGAIGVDSAAHRGALAAGGATVVVLGTGLDVVYPERNRGLYTEVVEAGGALVSMFRRGQPPRRGHFVARNAVIAAWAEAVVVVAAERGSGSLSTAAAARRLGVGVAAVAGTAGADALIRAGASAVASGADLERVLAGEAVRPTRRDLDDDERALWEALAAAPDGDAVALAGVLGWRAAAVAAALDELCDAGWARALPGDRYAAIA